MKKKCRQCGKTFETKSKAAFCSKACRNKYDKKTKKVVSQVESLENEQKRDEERRKAARAQMLARLRERDKAYAAAFPNSPGVRRVACVHISAEGSILSSINQRFH